MLPAGGWRSCCRLTSLLLLGSVLLASTCQAFDSGVLLDPATQPEPAGFRRHRGGLPVPRRLAAGITQPLTPVSPIPDSHIVSDGQRQVVDTTILPFSAIGQIRLTGNGTGISYCTGALINLDPAVVLTAGHCWYDPSAQVPGYAGAFVPGYNVYAEGLQAPFGHANVTGAKVPAAFVDCVNNDNGSYTPCDANSDWSLLFLDGPATPHTLSVGFDDIITGAQTLYTAGYPGDKCQEGGDFYQCPMWYTTCPNQPFLSENATGIEACVSGGGQSGSPIWLQPQPNEIMVTGILTSGPFNEPESDYTADGESPTQYTQITEKVFDLIQASIADGLGTETKGMITYEADTSVDAYDYSAYGDYGY